LADVTLPSLGESVTEGIITRWMKNVGDVVARDEPLFEISTDKVDSELPSPAEGVLLKILANEGDTVNVGAVVAVIGELDGAASPTPAPTTPSDATPTKAATEALTPHPSDVSSTTSEGPSAVVSPLVRRILADGGVDVRAVTGTGPGGTITRRDAELAVANGPTDDIVVPLTPGLRRMAAHMVDSVRTSPHGFVAVEVDASIFERLDAVGRVTNDGVAISDDALVILAAVRALAEFPYFNATVIGDDLVEHRTINVGVLHSLQPAGMLVPVIHAAGGLTVRSLARRMADLRDRVATRQLTTDDLSGGTIAVLPAPTPSTLVGVPLLIQPNVAAISIGAVRTVPVVQDRDGVATIEIGRRVVLGLSFDHRVADPTSASLYLERVGQLLGSLNIDAER
jgi:2-oxoglutarate dehydrogenase E2 component (dihydrolipoamide succinyltransferase)